MTAKNTVSVIGGDSRLLYAARRLGSKGFDSRVYGFELYTPPFEEIPAEKKLNEALLSDVIVFGLPCSRNGKTLWAPFCETEITFEDIIKNVPCGRTVYGGMMPGAMKERLKNGGCTVYDYGESEALLLYNAMLTAEALTGILITKLPCSLSGADIAITGYGRIGFYLARFLRSFGAKVTVFSRDPAGLARAQTLGMEAQHLKSFCDKKRWFSALINTAPSQIIGRKELEALNKDCVLFETASAPFGIDARASEELGFTLHSAPSLPGRYSPLSAGYFIADAIENIAGEVENSG
ncbi:MAG: hypothetical protein IJS90_05365 [Clostridia bacterium]|nr:hypothetical protein [Clostridia bacterium]